MLRGEERELKVKEALEQSAVTQWLRGMKHTWHWTDEPTWQVTGDGSVESTPLTWQPSFVGDEALVLAEFRVSTGWHRDADHTPGLQLWLDLMFNISGLDSAYQLRPADSSNDGPSSALKLSLDELGELLVSMLGAVQLAADLATVLLPTCPDRGVVGLWLHLNGIQLSQAVDLSALTLLPNSPGNAFFQKGAHVPLPEVGDGTPEGSLVAQMLDEAIYRAGYRGLGNALARTRRLNLPVGGSEDGAVEPDSGAVSPSAGG